MNGLVDSPMEQRNRARARRTTTRTKHDDEGLTDLMRIFEGRSAADEVTGRAPRTPPCAAAFSCGTNEANRTLAGKAFDKPQRSASLAKCVRGNLRMSPLILRKGLCTSHLLAAIFHLSIRRLT